MTEKTETVRLQKYLSEQGVCSRREAEKLIEAGKISVNGKTAVIGQKVTGTENIVVEGKKLSASFSLQKLKKVIAFYKPVGVECTMAKIPEQKTLMDFKFGPERVFPIGRLDKDSEGLLLLTNDGLIAARIMHPSFKHEKDYFVRVDKDLTPAILKKLSSGTIEIDERPVQACEVKKVAGEPRIFQILLREGRNRQIRKMCEACDLKVRKLLRTRIENIHLGELKPGRFRVLGKVELESLRKRLGLVR